MCFHELLFWALGKKALERERGRERETALLLFPKQDTLETTVTRLYHIDISPHSCIKTYLLHSKKRCFPRLFQSPVGSATIWQRQRELIHISAVNGNTPSLYCIHMSVEQFKRIFKIISHTNYIKMFLFFYVNKPDTGLESDKLFAVFLTELTH